MRLKRILIIGAIFPVLFSIVLFFGILISGEDDDSSNSYSTVYSGMNLSADVLKHQPMVEKYARENGITEYVNVLDRKSTRLNSSHNNQSRMPSSA